MKMGSLYLRDIVDGSSLLCLNRLGVLKAAPDGEHGGDKVLSSNRQ